MTSIALGVAEDCGEYYMAKSRFFRTEEIVGKNVYDLKGKFLGKVVDIGFSNDGRMGLVVDIGEEEAAFFDFAEIAAIGDIVLVASKTMTTSTRETSSQASQAPSSTTCPSCGNPVKPGSIFCTKCGIRLVI